MRPAREEKPEDSRQDERYSEQLSALASTLKACILYFSKVGMRNKKIGRLIYEQEIAFLENLTDQVLEHDVYLMAGILLRLCLNGHGTLVVLSLYLSKPASAIAIFEEHANTIQQFKSPVIRKYVMFFHQSLCLNVKPWIQSQIEKSPSNTLYSDFLRAITSAYTDNATYNSLKDEFSIHIFSSHLDKFNLLTGAEITKLFTYLNSPEGTYTLPLITEPNIITPIIHLAYDPIPHEQVRKLQAIRQLTLAVATSIIIFHKRSIAEPTDPTTTLTLTGLASDKTNRWYFHKIICRTIFLSIMNSRRLTSVAEDLYVRKHKVILDLLKIQDSLITSTLIKHLSKHIRLILLKHINSIGHEKYDTLEKIDTTVTDMNIKHKHKRLFCDKYQLTQRVIIENLIKNRLQARTHGDIELIAKAILVGFKTFAEWLIEQRSTEPDVYEVTQDDCFTRWIRDEQYQFLQPILQSSSPEIAKNLDIIIMQFCSHATFQQCLYLFPLMSHTFVSGETLLACEPLTSLQQLLTLHGIRLWEAYQKISKENDYFFNADALKINAAEYEWIHTLILTSNLFIQHCLGKEQRFLLASQRRNELIWPWDSAAAFDTKGESKDEDGGKEHTKNHRHRFLTEPLKDIEIAKAFLTFYQSAKKSAPAHVITWLDCCIRYMVTMAEYTYDNQQLLFAAIPLLENHEGLDLISASLSEARSALSHSTSKTEASTAAGKRAKRRKRNRRKKPELVPVPAPAATPAPVSSETKEGMESKEAIDPKSQEQIDADHALALALSTSFKERLDAHRSTELKPEAEDPSKKAMATPASSAAASAGVRAPQTAISDTPGSDDASSDEEDEEKGEGKRQSAEIPPVEEGVVSKASPALPSTQPSAISGTTLEEPIIFSKLDETSYDKLTGLNAIRKAQAYFNTYQAAITQLEHLPPLDATLFEYYLTIARIGFALKSRLITHSCTDTRPLPVAKEHIVRFRQLLKRISAAMDLSKITQAQLPAPKALNAFQLALYNMSNLEFTLIHELQHIYASLYDSESRTNMAQLITALASHVHLPPIFSGNQIFWMIVALRLSAHNMTLFEAGTSIIWPHLAEDVDLVLAPTDPTAEPLTIEALLEELSKQGVRCINVKSFSHPDPSIEHEIYAGQIIVADRCADIAISLHPMQGKHLQFELSRRLFNVASCLRSLQSGLCSFPPHAIESYIRHNIIQTGSSTSARPLLLKVAMKASVAKWRLDKETKAVVTKIFTPSDASISFKEIWWLLIQAQSETRLRQIHEFIFPALDALFSHHGLKLPHGKQDRHLSTLHFSIMLNFKRNTSVLDAYKRRSIPIPTCHTGEYRVWYYITQSGLLDRIYACISPLITPWQPELIPEHPHALCHSLISCLIQSEKLAVLHSSMFLVVLSRLFHQARDAEYAVYEESDKLAKLEEAICQSLSF